MQESQQLFQQNRKASVQRTRFRSLRQVLVWNLLVLSSRQYFRDQSVWEQTCNQTDLTSGSFYCVSVLCNVHDIVCVSVDQSLEPTRSGRNGLLCRVLRRNQRQQKSSIILVDVSVEKNCTLFGRDIHQYRNIISYEDCHFLLFPALILGLHNLLASLHPLQRQLLWVIQWMSVHNTLRLHDISEQRAALDKVLWTCISRFDYFQ